MGFLSRVANLLRGFRAVEVREPSARVMARETLERELERPIAPVVRAPIREPTGQENRDTRQAGFVTHEPDPPQPERDEEGYVKRNL